MHWLMKKNRLVFFNKEGTTDGKNDGVTDGNEDCSTDCNEDRALRHMPRKEWIYIYIDFFVCLRENVRCKEDVLMDYVVLMIIVVEI